MYAFKDDCEEDVEGSEEGHTDNEAAEVGAEDEDQALTERQSGVEEFEDKEHEAQFCLENNFMDEDGQEDRDSAAEHKDGKGRKSAGNNLKVGIWTLCTVSLSLFCVYLPIKHCSTFAGMFLEHLDTQLDEEDVQKIVSGTKTKNQITVVKST